MVRQQDKLQAFIRVARNMLQGGSRSLEFKIKAKVESRRQKSNINPNIVEIRHEWGSSDELYQTVSGMSVGFFCPVLYIAALIPGHLKDILKSFILAGTLLVHDLHLLATPSTLHKTSRDKG